MPISGHVADAATGKPLAHALVRWQGTGDVGSPQGGRLNDPSIRGQMEADSEGNFTLPHLTIGHFEVRVSAPRYWSDGQYLSERLTNTPPAPLPKLPERICMARYGRPDCTVPPPPDGNFLLEPDSLHVEPISVQAQSLFLAKAPEFRGLWKVNAGALSPDGQKLAFIAWFPVTLDEEGLRNGCRGWIYNHGDGQIREVHPSLPKEFCDQQSTNVQWDNDSIVISFREIEGVKPELKTIRWQDGNALGPTSRELPGENIYVGATFKTPDNELILDPSPDGAYATAQAEDENCPRCVTMLVVNRSGTWERKLDGLNGFSHPRFDPDSTLMAWFSGQSAIDLVLVELGTDNLRRIAFPGFRRDGDLIAVQRLDDGKVRVAYQVPGDCDLYGPAAPFNPAAGVPPTPKAAGLCFATIPALRAAN